MSGALRGSFEIPAAMAKPFPEPQGITPKFTFHSSDFRQPGSKFHRTGHHYIL
jgi:hypothetical protein